VNQVQVSERVGFNSPLDTQQVIFEYDSFQAIDCTGADNQKQRNKTLHTS